MRQSMRPEYAWIAVAMQFGEQLARQLNIAFYAVVREVGQNQRILDDRANWINEPLAVTQDLVSTSRSPAIAQMKASELVARHPLSKDVIMCTPVLKKENGGLGFAGGVRHHGRIVAVSGRDQYHDEFLAALMMCGGSDGHKPGVRRVFTFPYGYSEQRGEVDATIIEVASLMPESLETYVAGICRAKIEVVTDRTDTSNFGKEITGVFIEKSKDDDRGPAVLGGTAVSFK